jgi:hypothetical protein
VDRSLEIPLAFALARWQAATGLDLRRTPGDVWVSRTGLECGPETYGCFSRLDRRIVVTDQTPDVMAEQVLVHEIGHALGVRHLDHLDSTPPESIMRSTLGGTECITLADVRAVCAASGGCRWQRPEAC